MLGLGLGRKVRAVQVGSLGGLGRCRGYFSLVIIDGDEQETLKTNRYWTEELNMIGGIGVIVWYMSFLLVSFYLGSLVNFSEDSDFKFQEDGVKC